MKKVFIVIMLVLMALLVTGCDAEADVASRNLSTSADSFEIVRRIVFYNAITDTPFLTIEGLCSLGNYDSNLRMSVTCKTGEGQYLKHFLGLSDNVSFYAEQLDASTVDAYHYRFIARPTQIIPDIELDLP